jgi:hypothetical protein
MLNPKDADLPSRILWHQEVIQPLLKLKGEFEFMVTLTDSY